MQVLPKTRSGKILRRTIRQISNRQEYKMPATIDDEKSLEVIANARDAWLALNPNE